MHMVFSCDALRETLEEIRGMAAEVFSTDDELYDEFLIDMKKAEEHIHQWQVSTTGSDVM